MTQQPKGSMCAACQYALKDCSHLLFSSMPALSKYNGVTIVRCTEFEHVNRPTQRQAHRCPGDT